MTLNFVAGATFVGAGVPGLPGADSRVCKPSARTSRHLRVRMCAETKETLVVKEKADIGALGGIDDLFEARELLDGLSEQGDLKKWNRQKLSVRPVSIAELKMNARLDADSLGLTQKNTIDLKLASFAVIGGSSLLAVLCQAVFSGDLAYFSSYLIGGLSIAFLAIGSTAPGLLTALITTISANLRPDFKERLLLHEAGHFLAGYLCGVPVKKYDVNPITTGVTIFGGKFLTEDVAQGRVSRDDVNALSVVALAGTIISVCTEFSLRPKLAPLSNLNSETSFHAAGPAAEVIKYGQAEGGMADLNLLQNLLVRTKPPMLSKEQQEQTRWGALMAYT
uniref:Peptidase M41 domain-containing protein n=1 Tax=Rhodosorus marinus TaxID=101924 RepID=A0A7S3A9G7_9RHOD|mmetsp:Transcript_812/g.2051  ORF Transcript_812/g.2051 Transcript_812/m.2051 type:complete len:336 (+) Transcript_812:148-1155(+)